MIIEANGAGSVPCDGTLSQFITEHYWGYTKQRGGGCLEYEVQHPRWVVREADAASFTGNAARYYGSKFGEVLGRRPDSAFLADGSPVTIFWGTKIL